MPERPPVPADPAERIRIERIYRAARVSDGRRILVDRLWPRGVAKDRARLFCWCRDIAPSDALRQGFHADPDAWEDFRAGYLTELEQCGDLVRRIAGYAREGVVTLLYAAKDEVHNNAAVLRAQIDRCLGLGIGAFSFFRDVVPEAVARAKASGCLVLHQVGTLRAAREAEAAGADVLIARGIEAGGHVHGRSGAFALAADLLRQTHLPAVVSGGIVDGKGLAAALAMGAAGVQCGTAFLATEEAFAHDVHKARVVAAGAEDTVLTDIFVLNWPKGAAVRVIANDVTAALDGRYLGHDPADLPRQAIARDDGAPRLRCSTDSPLRTTTGDLEAMALYAGQGVEGIDAVVPAGEWLSGMAREAAELLACRAPGRTDEGKKS